MIMPIIIHEGLGLAAVLGFQLNWEGDAEIPHMPPAPFTCTASPLICSPCWNGTFVTTEEPAETHHYHPKSVVYPKFHPWCCTFYRFVQRLWWHVSLHYHTEYFHCLKDLLCSISSSWVTIYSKVRPFAVKAPGKVNKWINGKILNYSFVVNKSHFSLLKPS